MHVPEFAPADELGKVDLWRCQELERAGYTTDDARLLAVHHEVDLHAAIGLLGAGCDPTTALRILL